MEDSSLLPDIFTTWTHDHTNLERPLGKQFDRPQCTSETEKKFVQKLPESYMATLW